jgi:pimeloyl-ACP methyl ester carboxylesterase
MRPQTQTLQTQDVELVYDVRGPLPPTDSKPPLLMIGAPMDASGFATLASYFADRTVVTYDPRGLGRSVRKDGRVDHTPADNAADVHHIIQALGRGPMHLFASSGGAVTALELVAKHPQDVSVLIAHEPPLIAVVPDAVLAARALDVVQARYMSAGWGAGMAAFVAMTSWQGEFTETYLAQPAPDPELFGMPAHDDGSRDDPLLSNRSRAVTDYRPDLDALKRAATRIVIAYGIETGDAFSARTARGMAALLGQTAVEFPSHHGGFLGGEHGYAGQPEAFADRLRELLEA